MNLHISNPGRVTQAGEAELSAEWLFWYVTKITEGRKSSAGFPACIIRDEQVIRAGKFRPSSTGHTPELLHGLR